MPPAYDTLLPRLDRWIRDGHGAKAQPDLEKMAASKVPRAYAARVGQLAWRAGLAPLGLRVLNPIVRPREKAPVIASHEEQAEYAACLLKVGAWDEAASLLKSLSPVNTPQVWLYLAFAAVARWDYAESIPFLEKYLLDKRITPYQRMVGEVNLAAAFVHERVFLKATPLLRQLLYRSSVQRSQLVLGRVLELSAENFIEQKKYARAEPFLKRAQTVLADSKGIDLFFVRKFRAIIAFLEGDPSELKAFRKESLERRHWETVRDLDRVEALHERDSKLLTHLYFGTPFAAFRESLLRQAGEWKPAEKYRWRLGGKDSATVVQVAEGKRADAQVSLKPGQAVHRLLMILASDFYRPFRTATLCNQLYPGEHFHPEHSATKLRQVFLRLRDWIREEKLGLVIDEENGNYRLVASQPVVLELSRNEQLGTKERPSLVLEQIRERFPQGFGAKEAADALGLSARALQRILEKALSGELIQRVGKGKKTRYQFRGRLPATGS